MNKKISFFSLFLIFTLLSISVFTTNGNQITNTKEESSFSMSSLGATISLFRVTAVSIESSETNFEVFKYFKCSYHVDLIDDEPKGCNAHFELKIVNNGEELVVVEGYKGGAGFGSTRYIFNEHYISESENEEFYGQNIHEAPSSFFIGKTTIILTVKNRLGWDILDEKEITKETNNPESDLICTGEIKWEDVIIDDNNGLVGSFFIENACDEIPWDGGLDWRVVSWPSWGMWDISPRYGEDLGPGAKIEVSVLLSGALNNKAYTGSIKVENQNDESDFDTVQVSLIPKTKSVYKNYMILEKIFTNKFFSFLKFFSEIY